MLTDTSPEILRIQAALLSQLSDEQRLMKAVNHTQFVRELSRRAIAKANPHLCQREQQLLFVEVQYGCEMAERLRTHLASIR